MGTKITEKEYGPSWYDVKVALYHLSKDHDRTSMVDVSLTFEKDGSSYLYWRVVSVARTGPFASRGEIAEGHKWPATDWKTVPAMLLALIHRLDWRLTERERVAESQAAF